MGTPVFPETHDAKFVITLEKKLGALIVEQICRRAMYHGAADEWPIGHTPPEVKEKRHAELKALEELDGVTSNDGSDSDNDDNDVLDAEVGPGKLAAPLGSRKRSCQADWLPTPPLSAESPLDTSHRRKRRRISGDDKKDD